MLSYDDTLRFLYENLPMFQRIGAAALKNDLTNTVALCTALGDPQKKFKSIHVAGTNGKGSSSHMLASIFQSAGYKTGLYTSPHLKEFTERIKINGAEVSRGFIIDFVDRIRPVIERIKPSFFEITVAMAFDYFAQNNIDVAMIEVGLGGRLDSTNVITPELSLITNIGWDHKDILGDTLEKIASEKAGIIKPGVPVVISERQENVEEVFIRKSNEVSAPLYFATDRYKSVRRGQKDLAGFDIFKDGVLAYRDLQLPLQGFYQGRNILGVINSVDLLRKMGWNISDNKLLEGLDSTVRQTGLKGRWQILGEHPLKVCDTAHNIDGMREVVRQIDQQVFHTLHLVIGMVKDKDITQVLRLLPKHAHCYFCQAKIPRALDAGVLAEQALNEGLTGVVIADVNEAISLAETRATADDMIFIGGSTFVVAEIENL